jgi:hypothetical protein
MASNRSKFNWHDEAKLELAKVTNKHKGYIKTATSHEVKWVHILAEIKSNPLFGTLDVTAATLKTAFDRHQKEILRNLGISEEGANLSGLMEKPSDYELLMINMAQEEAKLTKKVIDEKEKRARLGQNLLTHESSGLKDQARVRTTCSLAPGEVEVVDLDEEWTPATNSSNSLQDQKRKKRRLHDGAGMMDSFRKELFDLVRFDVNADKNDADKQIEHMERRQKIEHNERELKLREDQLALQRQQLELQVEQNKQLTTLLQSLMPRT